MLKINPLIIQDLKNDYEDVDDNEDEDENG